MSSFQNLLGEHVSLIQRLNVADTQQRLDKAVALVAEALQRKLPVLAARRRVQEFRILYYHYFFEMVEARLAS